MRECNIPSGHHRRQIYSALLAQMMRVQLIVGDLALPEQGPNPPISKSYA